MTRHRSWSEVTAEMAERRARYAARPFYMRKPADVWRGARRQWYRFRHPPPWARVKWMWQRARRGWSDADAWGLDNYITRILAEALPRVGEHTYPGVFPYHTPELWKEHLRWLAGEFAAWNEETFLDEEAYRRAKVAMEVFSSDYGLFWD